MKIFSLVLLLALLNSRLSAEDSGAAPKTDPELTSRLQKKVTFEFVEQTLTDSINFLNTLTKLNIIVDPKTAELQKTPITLRVNDVAIGDALKQILDKAGMEAVPCDGAIFLCKKGSYVAKKPETPKPLTDEQIAAFKTALSQLGQDEFETREKASRAIANLGPGALSHIDEALKSGGDAETRARLQTLKETLTIAPNIFDEPAEVTKALNGLTRRLTFDFVDTSIDEAVNFLKTVGAGEIVVDGDSLKIPNMNLHVVEMSVGMSLRWIARTVGMEISVKDGKIHLSNSAPDKQK